MFGNRRKAVLVSAALLGGIMLTTACQETDKNSGAAQGTSPAAAPAPATVPAAAPAGSSTTGGNQGGGNQGGKTESTGKTSAGKSSGGQGTTGGTGTGANGEIRKCFTDDLNITAQDATIGGDNDRTVAVTFKNIGHDCAMSGFAGVDLKTSEGPLSAKRTSEPIVPILLKSGQSVSFGIHYPIGESGGSGVRITGLQITPPGETKTVTLQWPGAATLPVTDGAGSPVTVGPMGSAGQGG
ncbi:DUF4232 domain-containing protein [Embleya sp. NPDC020886]|uniref:DUF4232 domain-containing protein n=1 Tax=Embleya sp. NPDC020886 TaxID=3363980 RepID=UPI00378A1957